MKTRVGHCKRDKCNIYIGRNPNAEKGKFGNPFTHKFDTLALVPVQTVEIAVEDYRKWLVSGAEFLESICILKGTDLHDILMGKRKIILDSLHELEGKVLGCWCKVKGHEPCHGDVLVELLEKNKQAI